MSRVTFNLPVPLTITQVQQDNYRTKTFVLDGSVAAHPGQFVMAWIPRFDEKPISLVSADPITLMITAVGPFSCLVHELAPGDRIWLRGPFGRGYDVPRDHTHLALVGGGYGVAPLYWLAESQLERGASVTAIIGARSADDLLYVERFRTLTAHNPGRRAELTLTTEDGSQGARGLVTDALAPLLATRTVQSVYACGPHGMLEAVRTLASLAVVPAQLSWEAYMRCGLGICGACEHEGSVLCLDGPVIRHSPS